MKKRYAFIILALLVFAIGTACGTDAAMMRNDDVVDDAYIFEYKQFTPSEEIVEGNETALNTIKKLYDKDNLNVMADFSITFDMSSNPVYGSNHSEADYYLHYKVSDYPAEYDILFLFKDDTEVVRGTNDKSCIYLNDDDKERVDKNFAVEVANYEDGVYAWKDNTSANAVLGKDVNYRCTSIWGYNENKNEVVLIWNNLDCPIWHNYS